MKPVMEVWDLSKEFCQKENLMVKAVDHVSFTVSPGECLGIVGESGSGKSTIAKLVTGLIPPTSGNILIDGQDIHQTDHSGRKKLYEKVQMVFQNPKASFDPRKTLGSGIGESLRNRGIPKHEIQKRVSFLLQQCGLPEEFASRYPHEVSGGQCQRAAIARALAVDPDLLICDEATSALDVTVQKQIMELLTELKQKRKLSFVFICHNLALVQQFCDRVIILYDGKMVEQGKPDEIIFAPASEYTKILVSSVFE